MADFETFITATNAAQTKHEVFDIFEHALKAYGYDRLCYSLITEHPSLGLEAGHGVVRNYAEDWMAHYIAEGYEAIDPVPKHCFATNRPFTWTEVTKLKGLTKKAQTVMDEAREAGLYDGVAVPIHGVKGELSGIGMASSTRGVALNPDMLCKIQALCLQFHLAYIGKEQQERQSCEKAGTVLTAREKEILLWAAEGKSDPVIADILGISYSTVRFHLNNIYQKLDANERTFAVVKAIRCGLILPSYVSELETPVRLVR